MYRIEIEAEAEKALRRMPANTAKRLRSKFLALAADPFARNPNVKKLTGRECYRLRSAVGGRFTRSTRPTRSSRCWLSSRAGVPMIRPQIIEREGKPEYAVIPIAEWRRIEALLEELEDIRDLDAALAKPDRRMIPFEVTSAILDGASPIRAWREHQGLSPSDLAQAAGISASQLAEIEEGTRRAAPAALHRLAKALRAHVADLSG